MRNTNGSIWKWLIVLGLVLLALFFLKNGASQHLDQHPMKQETAKSPAKEKAIYQCSMHPSIISDKPGNCPICGMRLTRVDGLGEMTSDVPGHAGILLTPERRQLIGVETTLVTPRPLSMSIRTVGRVAYDPELYSALHEYQEALKTERDTEQSGFPELREQSKVLVSSARLKLLQMGVSENTAKQFLSSSRALESLLLPEGIAWIYADIYEYEAGLVHSGQRVTLTAPAAPGKTFSGTVRSVDPILSAPTRTLRARVQAPNVGQMLKPEMFVDVMIRIPLGTKLAIPVDAVINTGESQLVFIDQGAGRIIPRQILVGHEVDGSYEVLSGLKAGERIVTSSTFLIDSESRLRAAAKKFGGSSQQGDQGGHIHH